MYINFQILSWNGGPLCSPSVTFFPFCIPVVPLHVMILFLIFQAMDVVIEREDFYSLVELLDKISHKWYDIASALRLSPSEIEKIMREKKTDSDRMTEVLKIFMNQPRPTVGKLDKALNELQIYMASQIKKSLLSYRRQMIGKLSIIILIIM